MSPCRGGSEGGGGSGRDGVEGEGGMVGGVVEGMVGGVVGGVVVMVDDGGGSG